MFTVSQQFSHVIHSVKAHKFIIISLLSIEKYTFSLKLDTHSKQYKIITSYHWTEPIISSFPMFGLTLQSLLKDI